MLLGEGYSWAQIEVCNEAFHGRIAIRSFNPEAIHVGNTIPFSLQPFKGPAAESFLKHSFTRLLLEVEQRQKTVAL